MNPTEAHVLIVGCGDLGAYLAQLFSASNFQVTGLSRSSKSLLAIKMLTGDVTQPTTLGLLHTLQPNIIIYCIAADGQTDAQYQSQYVSGLKNILATQINNPHLKSVLFVSSTRVYGQETNVILDETVPAIPNDFGGERLLEAERVLESLTCNTAVLRLSGIYGPGRLRMIHLAQAPERWPARNSWTNRIHRNDAARFIVYLVQMQLAGKATKPCYIVTDKTPCAQYEVLNWIAEKLHIQTANTTLPITGGKRLSNRAMLATGFTLNYSDYQAGYTDLLNQQT